MQKNLIIYIENCRVNCTNFHPPKDPNLMPFYRWANYVVGENGFCVEGREKAFNNQNVTYFYKTTNQKKTIKV